MTTWGSCRTTGIIQKNNKIRLLKISSESVLLKDIHFDANHPENHNVKIVTEKRSLQ